MKINIKTDKNILPWEEEIIDKLNKEILLQSDFIIINNEKYKISKTYNVNFDEIEIELNKLAVI